MREILSLLFEAFGWFWVALILIGLAYTLVRWTRQPEPPWWDLEEAESQAAWDQARRDYADSLRPQLALYPQPVRDELLKLAGKVEDRRRERAFAPRDAA